MIESLPTWITILFCIVVTISLILLYQIHGKNKVLILILLVWTGSQSWLAYLGFYQDTSSFPPRFILVLLPALIGVGLGLIPRFHHPLAKDRNFSLSTLFHTIRIPIEIILFYLFSYRMVPELMTFEGRNFDILAGISAPVISLLVFRKKISCNTLLGWNILCLCLVSFILLNGILSAELPFQQYAFDQPNKAVVFFPFILLPGLIVPMVIFIHITDIKILLKTKADKPVNTQREK
jgi:hypothetical protein